MKYSLKRALAVLIALLLALPTFAYAEAPADDFDGIASIDEGQPLISDEVDLPIEEVDEFMLGGDEPENPDEPAEGGIACTGVASGTCRPGTPTGPMCRRVWTLPHRRLRCWRQMQMSRT